MNNIINFSDVKKKNEDFKHVTYTGDGALPENIMV